MSLHLKIMGYGVALLLILALGSWGWDRWTSARSSEQAIVESQRQAKEAAAQVEQVKKELNTATDTITAPQNRKTGVKLVKVPADCQGCFTANKITLEDGNSLWHYSCLDVMAGAKGTLNADGLIRQVTDPFKAALADCQKSLKNACGSPQFFKRGIGIGAEGFYSLAGPGGALTASPFAFGGQSFSILPLVRVEYDNGLPGTDPRFQALAGIRVEIGRPK